LLRSSETTRSGIRDTAFFPVPVRALPFSRAKVARQFRILLNGTKLARSVKMLVRKYFSFVFSEFVV